MKQVKSIIVIVSFFLLSVSTNAQSIAIGLKGGLNFANLNVSSAGDAYNNRTGYHFGAFTLIKLSKIGIQPEILFSKQGSTFSLNGQNFNQNFDYVNIPVILKLYTVAGLNLQVGPQIGFLAGGTAETLDAQSNKISANASDFIKSSDISVALGLGWDLPFGLSIDGRYNLGVSDNHKDGATTSSVKNQVIQVSVGYKIFKLGK